MHAEAMVEREVLVQARGCSSNPSFAGVDSYRVSPCSKAKCLSIELRSANARMKIIEIENEETESTAGDHVHHHGEDG